MSLAYASGKYQLGPREVYLNELQVFLVRPNRSIIQIVDQLLSISLDHLLQIDWRDNILRVRQREGDWKQLELPIRKSIFRAILARLATLANESTPTSVSLYGGRSNVSVQGHPDLLIHFSCSNLTGDQWLELAASPVSVDSLKTTEKESHVTDRNLARETA